MPVQRIKRRTFLKGSAAAVSGAVIVGLGKNARAAWTPGQEINPDIPNLRVGAAFSDAMVTGPYIPYPVANQYASIDPEAVFMTTGRAAMALAGTDSEQEAWETIFQLPGGHVSWETVRVAIKVNTIYELHSQPAIAGKVSRELIRLGVLPENIILYDGSSGWRERSNCHDFYRNVLGTHLPAGVGLSIYNSLMGGTAEHTGGLIPAPVPDAGHPSTAEGMYPCVPYIADGTIHLLVNIAVNKGHGFDQGGFTLTAKNHFGTFSPMGNGGPDDWTQHKGYEYITAISKSDAILGGTPPRQQLCIVDSIWAAAVGPFDPPTHQPGAIVMGTFSPAVDYVTVRKIREALMRAAPNESIMDRIPADFGYTREAFEGMELHTYGGVTPTRERRIKAGDPLIQITRSGRTIEIRALPGRPEPVKVSLFRPNGAEAGMHIVSPGSVITIDGAEHTPGRYLVRSERGRVRAVVTLVMP